MNFEVLFQNRTYICCNVLSYLPKFTETDLFACMCFFPMQTTWCSRGGFRGGPKGLTPGGGGGGGFWGGPMGLPPPPPPPPPPFCGLLNISALHFQYGIHVFAKFKRSECTRFHLRELQSQKFSRRSMCPKLPRKVRRSQSHIATVHYISRPPLSQNPPSAPV